MEKNEFITPKQEIVPSEEKPLEIERKFLVKSLPENLDQYPHQEIAQGYIEVSEDSSEVRLRKKGNRYFHTIKSGEGKIREETEVEISEEQFNSLWPKTEGRRAEKIRYNIPYEGHTIELDVYQASLKGLISAEVEFNSSEASNQFIPPDWFDKDVTDDRRYKNQTLALLGLPQ